MRLQGLLSTLRDWTLSAFLSAFISQANNGRIPPWIEEDVNESQGTQGMRLPQASPLSCRSVQQAEEK